MCALKAWWNKAFREQQHPSASRSVNEKPFNGLTGWKLSEFHIDQLLGRSICNALWPKSKPIVHPTLYPTQISFIPCRSTFPFLKYAIKNLTLKIQGEGHGWGQGLKSQLESNILSTHILLVPCQSTLLLIKVFFKIWPSKSKVIFSHSSKSHIRYNILWTHILFVPYQSALSFLGYSYFKIWRWKFKVKVMGEVKVESHNMGPTFSRLTSLSFHVTRASHSWVMTFWENLTLKIKGQGHGWGHSSKSQCGSNILLAHIPFIPCQSGIRFLSDDFFKIWPWKSRVKVMGEVTVQSHNVDLTSYRLTSLSFHVNRASDSWVTTFSKFDLENQGSRSWVRSQFKVTMWV